MSPPQTPYRHKSSIRMSPNPAICPRLPARMAKAITSTVADIAHLKGPNTAKGADTIRAYTKRIIHSI